MNFVTKIIGELSYIFKGQNCQKDLEDGMSDRDLIKKYGEYTMLKVKDSLKK
jgi:hypothetical protein